MLAWVFGPREPADTTISFDPASLPDDLDAYLADAEAQVPNLRDGAQKRIVWAGAPGARTDHAIIYLHGFSASSEEIRPVPDRLASALGANLYFTRLSGHGRDGAAMAEPSVKDWASDLGEALAIGRRIGRNVIVLATSTGATLASVAAVDAALSRNVQAHIYVSPNFGVNDPRASLLLWPFARYWVPLVAGAERAFEPQNANHARYWTTRYPTVAAMPMQALVALSNRQDYGQAAVPALFLLSDADTIVRPDISRKIAGQWAAGADVVPVETGPGDDPNAHLIAGDILSPGQTDAAVATILDWLAAQ